VALPPLSTRVMDSDARLDNVLGGIHFRSLLFPGMAIKQKLSAVQLESHSVLPLRSKDVDVEWTTPQRLFDRYKNNATTTL
jgi:hypothetical protein